MHSVVAETAGDAEVHAAMILLQDAIKAGDVAEAESAACALAMLRATVFIEEQPTEATHNITLRLHIEDKEGGGFQRFTVSPSSTVRQLKQRVFRDYDFAPELQTWIVGRNVAEDSDTLEQFGVTYNDMDVFVYILSVDTPTVATPHFDPGTTGPGLQPISLPVLGTQPPQPASMYPQPASMYPQAGGMYPQPASMYPQAGGMYAQPASMYPQPGGMYAQPASMYPQPGGMYPQPGGMYAQPGGMNAQPGGMNAAPAGAHAQPGGGLPPRMPAVHQPVPRLPNAPQPVPRLVTPPQATLPTNPVTQPADMTSCGWQCPSCTFVNEPTRPGCELCATSRPADYVIPANYQPTVRELERLSREQQLDMITQAYAFGEDIFIDAGLGDDDMVDPRGMVAQNEFHNRQLRPRGLEPTLHDAWTPVWDSELQAHVQDLDPELPPDIVVNRTRYDEASFDE